MKQKYLFISITALLFVGGGLFLLYQRHIPQPTTVAQAQKVAPAIRRTCDIGGPASLPTTDQTYLEHVALSRLLDVPAGTQADVVIATYTGKTAVGSVKYRGSYGSYNFTAARTGKTMGMNEDGSSYNGGWKLTSFEACKT